VENFGSDLELKRLDLTCSAEVDNLIAATLRSRTIAVPCVKITEPIEMLFGLWARMGRRNHLLDLDGCPAVLRNVAMAANFGTKIAIDWLCVNDSE